MLYAFSIIAISLLARHFGYCQINKKLVAFETLLYTVVIGAYWLFHQSKTTKKEILYLSLGIVLFGGFLALMVSIYQNKNQYLQRLVQTYAEEKNANIITYETKIPLVYPDPVVPIDRIQVYYNQTSFALVCCLDKNQLDTVDSLLRNLSGLSLQYELLSESTTRFYPYSKTEYLNFGKCNFGRIDGSRVVSISRNDKLLIIEIYPGLSVFR